jgi:predicted MFS family arabinose efflux permease
MLAAGSLGSALLPALAGRIVGRTGWRPTLGLALPPLLLVAGSIWWTVPSRTADPTPTDGSEFAELREAVVDRSVLLATAAITIMIFTFQGLTAFLPAYLISEKGLSQGTAATLFAVVFVSGAGFQLVAGPLAERYGERRVLVAIAAVGILTVGALPFVDGVVALGALVAVLGSRVAAGPITNAYIVDTLPDAEEGSAWGLLRTVMFLISATGSVFVGWLSDAGWFDGAFLALAAITACAVGLYALLPQRE